jgi:phytoene dehydrogenase-like protein
MISYSELATPLSAEAFTISSEGAMYGLPATPERYRQKWLSVKTPVKGLYLTGADISSLGIVSAMMSGVATASFLNGWAGFFKIVRYVRKKSKK